MDYTQDMFLLSDSGYAMPFEEREQEVKVLLGYGEQKQPRTGQMFFHKGWDLNAPDYLLQALATGIVIGITTDEEHGMSLTIRYGKYDVIYYHLKHCLVKFGEHVVAHQNVATSGKFFHFGVKIGNEDIDPHDFLTMIYANMKAYEQAETANTNIPVNDMEVHTKYDADKEELEQLLVKYLPGMFGSIYNGTYDVPGKKIEDLRETFKSAWSDHCFYEKMPSLVNPLGLGLRARMWAEQFQNIFLSIFMSFMAQVHSIFLSSMTEEDKKKLVMGIY